MPLHAESVQYLNERKHCGVTDWKAGEAKLFKGKECKDLFEHDQGDQGPSTGTGSDANQSSSGCAEVKPLPGTTIYELMKVDGDQVFFSHSKAPNCGATPETRAAVLDTDVGDVFKRLK